MNPVWALVAFCLLGVVSFAPAATSVQEKEEYTRYVVYPKPHYGDGAKAALIKRGEYLVKVGDCAACHTSLKPGSKTFAGGLGLKTPFGTFYSPNITPDKETGIGSWTDEQFVKTMHRGVAPGLRFLFPVFPYLYYNRIKHDDLLAIKAYLFSLKPVHAPQRSHDVPFPLNIRLGQIGWRVLFFYMQNKGEYQDDPAQSAAWNRGAYLVQGLGHCGMCHTPINLLGAPKEKYFLRGTMVDGFYAPDITADGVIHDYSIEQVAQSLKTGKHLSGKGIIHGPMEEVEHNSLNYLQKDDLRAIATYLKTVHSKPLPKKHHNNDSHPGGDIYETHCAVCHDTGAGGAPKIGDQAAWESRIKQGQSVLVKHAIEGLGGMPAKGNCSSCDDATIEQAVGYMVWRVKHGSSEHGAGKGKPPQPTSLARGKKIFEQNCAVCHNPKQLDRKQWTSRLKEQGMHGLLSASLAGENHPDKTRNCKTCTDGDVIAAVKYMVQQSGAPGDYRLW